MQQPCNRISLGGQTEIITIELKKTVRLLEKPVREMSVSRRPGQRPGGEPGRIRQVEEQNRQVGEKIRQMEEEIRRLRGATEP
jgi:hypothetical protein